MIRAEDQKLPFRRAPQGIRESGQLFAAGATGQQNDVRLLLLQDLYRLMHSSAHEYVRPGRAGHDPQIVRQQGIVRD